MATLFEIDIAERAPSGELRFATRAVEHDLETAKTRALELAEGWTPRITVIHDGPVPIEAWYFDFEGRDGAGVWAHSPAPRMVEPKPPRG